MKIISNTKNKGFTLIELLATLAILSIVITIVIYASVNLITNAKENSYQVTINNVEKEASAYVLEDNSLIDWVNGITNDYEYQCVTIQNLIDKGFFKNDVLDSYVSEGIKIQTNNYIYLERDKNTKTITKNILLVNDRLELYSGLCSGIESYGNIDIDVEPEGWSREKVITITYKINNNTDKVSNYGYSYEVNENNYSSNFNKRIIEKKVTLTDNGTIYADIIDLNGNVIFSNSKIVETIDTTNPIINVTSTNIINTTKKVTLNMSDDGGIVAYYVGQENPNLKEVTWKNINETKEYNTTEVINSSGKWYFAVKDVVDRITVIEKEFYDITFSISNSNFEFSKVIVMKGNEYSIPNATANQYYTFGGWYTNSSYNGDNVIDYTPSSNIILYGKITENLLSSGNVKITGTNTYGNKLAATITNTNPNADNYSYQWYYNNINSTSGGTMISGATNKDYQIGDGLIGKYIYVIITATKNNYRNLTFSDITNTSDNGTEIVKRKPTATIGNCNSLTYNGQNQTLMSGGSNVTYANNSKKDANTYTVTITANANYMFGDGSTSKTKSCSIAKSKTATVSISNKTYNGTSQTGVSGSNVTITGTSNATNAGTYTAYATPNANYAWSDGTTTKKTLTWKISKGTATIGNCNGLTYNGKAQTLMSGGSNVNYSNNSKTNAGTYTVTITAKDNYMFSDGSTNKTKSCSIARSKTATVSTSNKTYNGTSQTGVSGSNVTITGTSNATNAGTYTAYATPNANYAWSDGTTTKKTLTWKVNYGLATASAKNVTYNGSRQTGLSGSNVTWSGIGQDGVTPGTYTAYATPNANYAWSDGTRTQKTFTWKINYGLATASAKNVTYTGSMRTGLSGTNVTWSGTSSASSRGTYTAYATPKKYYKWSDGTSGKKKFTWKIQ